MNRPRLRLRACLDSRSAPRLPMAIACAVALLAGCGRKSLFDVKSHCGELHHQVVAIRGSVLDTLQIPVIEAGAYRLSDGNDSIWVISRRLVPEEGAKLEIEGEVIDVHRFQRGCALEKANEDTCRILGGAIQVLAGSCVLLQRSRH